MRYACDQPIEVPKICDHIERRKDYCFRCVTETAEKRCIANGEGWRYGRTS